jgi:ribonuclease BN (tRNA processing enzyme)
MSEVAFVGTSDAFGAGGRRQSAVFLRAPGGGLLLDCGATTGSGLCEMGIEREEIETILVSHYHGDHFGGIPALLLAFLYEDARKKPLRIAGPPDIEPRVRALSRAMGYAIEERDWSFPILFEELPPGRDLELGPVRVRSFETLHQPHTNPHGLIVDTGSQQIAYSGDTGWFDELPRHVAGVDLFICECTYYDDPFEYHINHEGLVARKHELDCGRVILTHLGSQMTDRRGQAAFETADDGLRIRI